MKYKIFIVEDDEIIASLCKKHLTSWGYDAKVCEDFHNVLNEFISYDPTLVLLDISLPYFNGFKWCEDIRKISSVPIIFISSASDDMNMIMAMHLGADDFIAKPFSIDLLIAKIQAILRRNYDYKSSSQLLKYRDYFLNVEKASIIYGDSSLELTKNEFKIFKTLLENKGRIVKRETLMQKIWQTDEFIDDNTLNVNVNRLRKKLEDIGLIAVIETKKNLGYILKDEESV